MYIKMERFETMTTLSQNGRQQHPVRSVDGHFESIAGKVELLPIYHQSSPHLQVRQ